MILGLAALTLGAVACKKDYSCDCKWEEEHGDHHHDKAQVYDLGKVSKKDAETACDLQADAIKADPDHKDVDCKVKS